jgi:protocatechuate 3,4-dioxygenase, alpha subunit
MSGPKMTPSGSQTVGPYFRIGLEYLVGQEPVNEASADAIEIHGKVLDSNRAPVSDAMLEFWGADSSGLYSGAVQHSDAHPVGFHRVATDLDGSFSLTLGKPGQAPLGDGRFQAPHMLVLVFARGLLRHLITRVYFEQEPANASDPVLLEVPAERRHTLIACSDAHSPRVFHWNVILQGDNETAFFAW